MHIFRIVLTHSRRGYSEAVYRQTTDDFLSCVENAFVYFGGVPKTLVLNNLKAAVQTPDCAAPGDGQHAAVVTVNVNTTARERRTINGTFL
jgi:transposase